MLYMCICALGQHRRVPLLSCCLCHAKSAKFIKVGGKVNGLFSSVGTHSCLRAEGQVGTPKSLIQSNH